MCAADADADDLLLLSKGSSEADAAAVGSSIVVRCTIN